VKAITYDRYGPPDVLRLKDVPDPVPADGEVLIRVRAASANPRDWHFLRGDPYVMRLQFGLRAPRAPILGSDVSGVVEAIGRGVDRFRVGEEVYADVETGAFAQLVCAPQDLVAAKPGRLTHEQAAAMPLAAVTALQGLRAGPGHRVLIVGAAGGVGTFAVQLAARQGAEVTAVCSGRNADLVRSLGAQEAIDYTTEDPTAGGRRYDTIFQLAGTAPAGRLRRALAPGGALLLSSGEPRDRVFGPLGRIARAKLASPFTRQRVVAFMAKPSAADLDELRGPADAGELTPVIDRTYPLADTSDALRHLETGHARGKIVITV
jgi:NADPH:quinone reductase-like Zn-dependent oxidoreductase